MATIRRRALPNAAVAALASAVVLLAPRAARAQGGSGGFLFREPPGSLTLRLGWDQASAGSDLFDFTREQLTLGRSSFSSPTAGLELATRVTSRLDVVYGAAISASSRPSEFRDFVDDEDRPIEQRTQFLRVPLTVAGKLYLASRGTSYGRLAWVPARVAPWVGAGGGAMWYRFRQRGDFVDARTLAVNPATFQTSGWTPTVHANAGADVTVSPRLALATEARYTWGRGPVGGDYEDFGRIDLSGVQVTAGLKIRF